MKFKLDENLGARTLSTFAEFGHDVETVSSERLNGVSDPVLFTACSAEGRCLITLDLDFADVVRFPARDSPGIAVLRAPQSASPRLLASLIRDLLAALKNESIAGRLWVVEPGRIRVHEPAEGL